MKEMPSNIKELLKAHNVPNDDIDLIHKKYSSSFAEASEQKKKQHAEAKKNKQPNHTELAREARIIK